jgi:hypothetical protein
LRQQLITGPKRKRFVVVCIGCLSTVLFVLSLKVGSQEASLPFSTQLSEIRLLEPNSIDIEQERTTLQSIETSEGQLLDYVQCSALAVGQSKRDCLAIINRMLSAAPANGRLWLEKAKLISEESGLDDDAIFALKKSFEYSAREGWVIDVRLKFLLSVWIGLTPELQDLTISTFLASIADDISGVQSLATIYEESPLAHAGIAALIDKAPVDVQRRFLSLLRASLKS